MSLPRPRPISISISISSRRFPGPDFGFRLRRRINYPNAACLKMIPLLVGFVFVVTAVLGALLPTLMGGARVRRPPDAIPGESGDVKT